MRLRTCAFCCAVLLSAIPRLYAQGPDARSIVEKSAAANLLDFRAEPNYNHKETDHEGRGSKTYQITMIEATPYQRLIAINGRRLSSSQEAQELQKENAARTQRQHESEAQKRDRIAKYEKERTRNNNLMQQLTQAFNFTLIGHGRVEGFEVYKLKATPRPGYHPPDMDCQVLPGMQGELWIDKKTFQWVKVTAQVMHPVSIEGFLARIEPGTRFELEKKPVGNDIWMPAHFSMNSRAKVLFLVNRSSSEDETYFDYEPVSTSPK